jgi:hypothetical protein
MDFYFEGGQMVVNFLSTFFAFIPTYLVIK